MMKQKLYVCLFGLVMMTASCTVDDVSFNSSRILESLATLEEQAAAIKGTVTELEKMDGTLRSEIDSLNDELNVLQEEVERLSGVELQDSMLIVSLRESIAELDSLIPPMMREDSLLTEKMEELESYAVYLTDSVSSDTESWIFNTFATLEKFDSLCVEVVGIDTSVRLVNWVNGNMTGCRTLAGIKGRIQRLKGKIQGGNKEIASYETALAPIKRDMLEAYKSVIRTSIETMDGKLDDGLKGEISSANSAMLEDLAAIVEKVEEMEARVEKAESDVEEILSWVRSVSVVPDTEDGSVAIQENEGDFEVCLAVYPLAVADSIAKRGASYIFFEVVETETKASSIFTSLTVKSVKYEKELLKLTVSTSGLPSGVLSGEKRPFARVVFSSGKYLKGSDFFPLSYVRKVERIILQNKLYSMWRNDIVCLNPTTTPSNLDVTFSFKSSDPSVASVNDDGTVIAHKIGTVRVYAYANGTENVCDSCNVDVIPNDAIKAKFSISANSYIYFSRGSLRAVKNVSAGSGKEWECANFHFARSQMDALGSANIVAGDLADTVDLFGWSGTTGVPWGISTSDHFDYSGDFKDWGTAVGDGWKTMSRDEVDYLMSHRTVKEKNRCRAKKVTIGDFRYCVVFPPDDFEGTLQSSYTEAEWKEAEKNGLVCLVSGGNRWGDLVQHFKEETDVWTSTPDGSSSAFYILYGEYNSGWSYNWRYKGHTVRLVFGF